ncbi:hypothetical protein D3C83_225000 [compost metagenome]
MTLHLPLVAEGGAHDDRFEMVPIAGDRHALARQARFDPRLDLLGGDHGIGASASKSATP